MRSHYFKTLKTAVLAISVLLLGASVSFAQVTVNLTAGPATATLPDGSAVPMWGYNCGSTAAAICRPLNPAATSASMWSPVVITVPSGQSLTINLTNNLAFTPTGSTTPNAIPTSLVIVGQVGGGLGDATQRTTTPSPAHENLGTTWPAANGGAVFVPPSQGARVQSFSTEVAAATTAAGTCPSANCASLTWTAPRPGTYLLESGTHPSIQGPMGLYGIVVVTSAPGTAAGLTTGCAYGYTAANATNGTPAACQVPYGADIPMLFSEIDPAQNNAVQAAVSSAGFSESAVHGPYGSMPVGSINLLTPGHDYTSAPTVNCVMGTSVTQCATAVIDTTAGSPTFGQVTQVNLIANPPSYTSAPTIQFVGGGCTPSAANPCATANAALLLQSNTAAQCSGGATACYPPAVNYTPLYYLINGQAFDKTHASNSLFPASPTSGVTGGVLVRLVNAGLRMHVPSIVGSTTNGAGGFSLIAEDGNPLPGVPRVQSEVLMPAGKTYDVMIDTPANSAAPALPIYDRELSLSSNSILRDGGMLAYISINGSTLPTTGAFAAAATTAAANPDSYSIVPGQTLTVTDPAKGVLANDVNAYGAQLSGTVPSGLVFNSNGTFTYTGGATTFNYCINGSTTLCTTVTIGAASSDAGMVSCSVPPTPTWTSNVATTISIAPPGVLAYCKDSAGYALKVTGATPGAGLSSVTVDENGGFRAISTGAGPASFTFTVQSRFGTTANGSATLSFLPASGLNVKVLDGADKTTQITDYRWIIEEDRTFYINPNTTTNNGGTAIVPTFGTNFHTSYMPLIAAGCTGPLSCEGGQTLLGSPVVCDIGNGVCEPDSTGNGQTPLMPSQVHLDPTKRYYLTVFPGDAANPFNNGYGGSPVCSSTGGVSTPNGTCGHGMGGAPILFPATGTSVTVLTQPSPYPPAKLSVFVFEDDFPLNGEQDGGGGIDVLSPNEPGLGGFNIKLWDDAGGTGDATGQVSYDMFNMPLSNSLAGTLDPMTGLDACPLSAQATASSAPGGDGSQVGITGEIVTCPKYEADGLTLSPLAGQAVVANLFPGRYGVVATPAADRIARGEEWLQTNTLDGQKAHDSFLRIGEPSFFQEYGPAGFHVSIGFANPSIINARRAFLCNGTDANSPQPGTPYTCNNTLTGRVTGEHLSRTPDERLYSSGSYDTFGFTQCYISFGDADGEDFAFTKCAADGTFTLTNLPEGDWRITVFDQWNDMLVDGLSTPVRLSGGSTLNIGDIATSQWQANLYTSTFFDNNQSGVFTDYSGTPCTSPGVPAGCNPNYGVSQPGLSLVATNIRFRDGSYSNFNNTDFSGNAGFNEVFPLFSWYVVETDTTRYKSTGVHVVYDAGGPTDGTCTSSTAPCGASQIGNFMANTAEQVSVPAPLRVPGAKYCANADCPVGDGGFTAPAGPPYFVPGASTGRIDPPFWFGTYGWQGFSGQNSFLEFGKKPFVAGETGTIHGEVIYASTRPFDDPSLLIHTSWTPDVPNVTINLYQEGTAPDGSQSLTLVDTTKTTSWDDWAQGFYPGTNKPYMSCPGQYGAPTSTQYGDLFFFSLYNQPMWLDTYNNGGTPSHDPANWFNAQFKCYDGMHNWNQLQPAPYDGMYSFPSITGLDPTTGEPTGTNCTICVVNPDTSDHYRAPTDGSPAGTPWTPAHGGSPMLPPGKYVVEVVVPPGYELVKEEDKNILIGDNYIAPATSQFAGLGNIFILPDQAEIASFYNPNNPQNPTNTLGRSTYPNNEGDTGSIEQFWPCVGALRQVPDFISLYPQSGEVAPFAGAWRHLCDRKEVVLNEQENVLAKFWIFSSTHVAAHFTGVITDDYTSEFDPFSPQFGEKFSPPDLPVSIKDWTGTEISRVYADHWGVYDGLTYSTWEVNPPNPTGYAPTMMITCMNDPGPIPGPGGTLITDPLFNPEYSQFCYEIPFMPGQTQYMDTPVVPTSAFAGAGYNNPDCAYPNATPAIKEVDGDGIGPWVSASGPRRITITALGDVPVPNNAYSGPSATTPPYNQKTIMRHYGFGAQGGQSSVVLIGADGNRYPLTSVSWSDSQITGTVPSNLPACSIQQQSVYRGAGVGAASCGQLVITNSNGVASVDTVTVTMGGKAPTHIAASGSIQAAIDAAKPGDLLIIDPTCTTTAGTVPCTTSTGASGLPAGASTTNAAHNELLIMWKPVRLQGVGAASSIINANTHPAGKLNDWRARIDCLFGLTTDGAPNGGDSSCGGLASGWFGFNPSKNNPQVDRLPLEATVGWQASLNGNLAELLQEPSLMGALEGAGITVLSKGVFFPSDPFDPTLLAGFPNGTVLFSGSNGNKNAYCPSDGSSKPRSGFTSNFWCNPSSIDGVTIQDSSQGGGGVFVHGWGHNIQIANNRIQNNAGTLSGGINIGQGEHPGAYLQGSATNPAPGSCMNTSFSNLPNSLLPYCHDLNVNVHHNFITYNSSTGDELFSATPAGAGGVSFCTGSDFYKFNYNWVCGNLSTGDGGGLGHLGFSYNGDIEHNMFLFNQSTNPTIVTNGGAMVIMGAPDVDPTCGATTDQDCVVIPAGAVGPSDGTGPNLVINANMIIGNQAESGSGGGIALQQVNGSDAVAFPNSHCDATLTNQTRGRTPGCSWNSVQVTNNIIVNNVAGWDGGGVSFLDALAVNFINNTVMHNDSTASAGVLFDTIGAPLASTQGTNCIQTGSTTASCPQVGGLVSIQNSAVLAQNLAAGPAVVCPAGHGTNGKCATFSVPLLYNDVFWQNRSYYIGVGTPAAGVTNQQNQVALFNMDGTPAPTQPQADAITANGTGSIVTGGSGACTAASYWDIGARGDTGPANHNSTLTLTPVYSFLTDASDYPGSNNSGADPTVAQSYCNGSRIPPELGSNGWQVPPGISDATVPNPLFNLTPVATVDEGNNWINISWGPLALMGPNGQHTGTTADTFLGNYNPTSGSPTIGYIPAAGNSGASGAFTLAPTLDYYGNQRKTDNAVDAGAIEFQLPPNTPLLSVTGGPLNFGNVVVGTTSTSQTLTLHNTGNATAAGIAIAVATTSATPNQFARSGGSCGATLTAGNTCTITITFSPTVAAPATGTVTITSTNVASVTGSPVALSGTGIPAVRTATVSPNPLAFGNWAAGTTSNPMTLTVTNTGNVALAGGTFTFGGGAPQPYSRPGGAAGGTCGATLAVGANCTIRVVFAAPATTGAYNRTLTVAYTGATVTPTPVNLTGTSVATRGTVSITPNPLTITLPTGSITGTGTVTLTNSAASASSVAVTNVAVSGGTLVTYFFNVVGGSDTCTGANLAPGASCTVGVRFTNVLSPRGTNRAGTITFTDTATGSPQSGNLIGFATP